MSVFGVIVVGIFPHSDQTNSEYGHFTCSACKWCTMLQTLICSMKWLCLVCFFRGSYKQILNCQQKKIQTLKLCPYITIKANLFLLLYLKKGAETVSKFMNLHKDPFFDLIFRNAHPDAAFLDKFPLLLKLKN